MIALWHNTIETIPDGWHLCDGNGGTIDLRNKNPIGAARDYAPGETGGSTWHGHNFTGDGHEHTLPAGANIEANGYRDNILTTAVETGEFQPRVSTPKYIALAYIQKVA